MLPGGVGKAFIKADGLALKNYIISSQSWSFFGVVLVLSCFTLLISECFKDLPIFVFYISLDPITLGIGFLTFNPDSCFVTILDEADVAVCFSWSLMNALTFKGSIKLF